MDTKQEISKIAKDLTADVGYQYSARVKDFDFVISELRKAIAKHSKDQKKDPNNETYLVNIAKAISKVSQVTHCLENNRF